MIHWFLLLMWFFWTLIYLHHTQYLVVLCPSLVRLWWALTYQRTPPPPEWTEELGIYAKVREILLFQHAGVTLHKKKREQGLCTAHSVSFYTVFRAAAIRHNVIGRTVWLLNWLVFREWGGKDFPCLMVGKVHPVECGMCPQTRGLRNVN